MRRLKSPLATLVFFVALVVTTAGAGISGTITSTLTITEDSDLVGNVTCIVTGAPCISFGAAGIALRLNGFSITGQGDAATGCGGGQVANEHGILVNAMRGAVIQGPGVVQRFRGMGIQIGGASSRVLVTRVTTSTNCLSGIIVTQASSDNELEANISVRNGNVASPCGGI